MNFLLDLHKLRATDDIHGSTTSPYAVSCVCSYIDLLNSFMQAVLAATGGELSLLFSSVLYIHSSWNPSISASTSFRSLLLYVQRSSTTTEADVHLLRGIIVSHETCSPTVRLIVTIVFPGSDTITTVATTDL